MGEEKSESCRICLSTELHKSYSLLLDHEDIGQLQISLTLLTDLSDSSIKPAHICDDCHTVTKRFMKLRRAALENEMLVIKYQKEILTSGLKVVKDNIESIDLQADNNCIADCLERTDIDEYYSDDDFEDEEQVKRENSKFIEEEIDFKDEYNCETKPNIADIQRRIGQFSHINDTDFHLATCNICGKQCKSKHVLRSHMLVHTSKRVKCPKCIPDKFMKENSLKKHLKNSHKEADVQCEYPGCDKMFKLREVMQRHIKSVHMLERTICSNCGAAVINLSYHLETCNKDNLDNITCKICKKQFSCKMYLTTHIKTVHGPTALEVCTVCGKSVKNVKSHIKWKHSDNVQKTNLCEVEGCDAMFRTKTELRTHNSRVHMDVKTQCTICLQWYKNLAEHVSQVHQQDRKHVCSQCGKQFFKNSDLKTHIERVHHGRRYICPECGKTVSKIREHLKCVHGISDPDQDSITIVTASVM